MVGPARPVRALRTMPPVLALVLALVAADRSAAQGLPPAPALVTVAEAFTAAWNAHDLPAVPALLAPHAAQRGRRGAVPGNRMSAPRRRQPGGA